MPKQILCLVSCDEGVYNRLSTSLEKYLSCELALSEHEKEVGGNEIMQGGYIACLECVCDMANVFSDNAH